MPVDAGTIKWLENCKALSVYFDEPMDRHTSFRVGGPADLIVEPETTETLMILLDGAWKRRLPVTVVGGGTNLLVNDNGIRGMVIKIKRGFNTFNWSVSTGKLETGAGVLTKTICRTALQNGLKGINFALGIPGTLGGAIAVNAGAAGGSMKDVVKSLNIITYEGRIREVENSQLNFEYRKVCWNLREIAEQGIILKAILTLEPGDPEKLRAQARNIVRSRKAKQPVGAACAGSFFKNPETGPPAGALIDRAGLKGKAMGGAMVSKKHANFLINTGNATAQDILNLMSHVQETVFRTFNIALKPEVRFLGF
jgi:UDP-N-acetylmuramate dehydrogenase